MTGKRYGRARVLRVWIVCVVSLAVAACSRVHVPVPLDDATPEQVVQAYADAVGVGDCETAAALVADRTSSWCGRVTITALTVTGVTWEHKETGSSVQGPMIERVWVHMETRGGDVSLPDGAHVWSYLLDQTGPNGAWRIYDQGLG